MSYSASEFQQRFPSIAANLDAAEIGIFLSIVVPTENTAGDVLIRCGAHNDTMYMVWKGLLAISIEAGEKKLLLGEASDGKWVGETALIDPGPAMETVVAEKQSTLLALSHDGFLKLREDHAKIASALLKALSFNLANRLRQTRQFLKEIDDDAYTVEKTGENKDSWLTALGKAFLGVSE